MVMTSSTIIHPNEIELLSYEINIRTKRESIFKFLEERQNNLKWDDGYAPNSCSRCFLLVKIALLSFFLFSVVDYNHGDAK
jgi:hypothetical protein